MDSLMKYINRIHRCAGQYRSARLPKTELRAHQHIYIFHICRHPGISQEQLAKRICVNKSNVTRQLNNTRSRVITRRPDDADRRILRVFPTPLAEGLYPRVLHIMQEWNALLLAELSDGEKAQFIGLLERITARAIRAVEGKDGLIPDPEDAAAAISESGEVQA